MNLFPFFYCNAYDAYNTNGKKKDDTLRLSSIALVSLFQCLNIIAPILFAGLFNEKLKIANWVGLIVAGLVLIGNHLFFNKTQSINLRNQYSLMTSDEKRRTKRILILYKTVSILLVCAVIFLAFYLKEKAK